MLYSEAILPAELTASTTTARAAVIASLFDILSVVMSVTQQLSTSSYLQKFLETEDFTILEKPIIFETTDKYKSFLCCCGAVAGITSFGLAALFTPIGVCCPIKTFKHFGLRLDKDSVQVGHKPVAYLLCASVNYVALHPS